MESSKARAEGFSNRSTDRHYPRSLTNGTLECLGSRPDASGVAQGDGPLFRHVADQEERAVGVGHHVHAGTVGFDRRDGLGVAGGVGETVGDPDDGGIDLHRRVGRAQHLLQVFCRRGNGVDLGEGAQPLCTRVAGELGEEGQGVGAEQVIVRELVEDGAAGEQIFFDVRQQDLGQLLGREEFLRPRGKLLKALAQLLHAGGRTRQQPAFRPHCAEERVAAFPVGDEHYVRARPLDQRPDSLASERVIVLGKCCGNGRDRGSSSAPDREDHVIAFSRQDAPLELLLAGDARQGAIRKVDIPGLARDGEFQSITAIDLETAFNPETRQAGLGHGLLNQTLSLPLRQQIVSQDEGFEYLGLTAEFGSRESRLRLELREPFLECGRFPVEPTFKDLVVCCYDLFGQLLLGIRHEEGQVGNLCRLELPFDPGKVPVTDDECHLASLFGLSQSIGNQCLVPPAHQGLIGSPLDLLLKLSPSLHELGEPVAEIRLVSEALTKGLSKPCEIPFSHGLVQRCDQPHALVSSDSQAPQLLEDKVLGLRRPPLELLAGFVEDPAVIRVGGDVGDAMNLHIRMGQRDVLDRVDGSAEEIRPGRRTPRGERSDLGGKWEGP